jgi:hypothetical protein
MDMLNIGRVFSVDQLLSSRRWIAVSERPLPADFWFLGHSSGVTRGSGQSNAEPDRPQTSS